MLVERCTVTRTRDIGIVQCHAITHPRLSRPFRTALAISERYHVRNNERQCTDHEDESVSRLIPEGKVTKHFDIRASASHTVRH